MKFLVVDENPDNRFLFAKTLLRRFPDAAIVECQSVETATLLVAREPVDLVVTHRTFELPCAELVSAIRAVNPRVPIIATSGMDQARAALAAGANAFHVVDEWLTVGCVAAKLLADPNDAVAEPS